MIKLPSHPEMQQKIQSRLRDNSADLFEFTVCPRLRRENSENQDIPTRIQHTLYDRMPIKQKQKKQVSADFSRTSNVHMPNCNLNRHL